MERRVGVAWVVGLLAAGMLAGAALAGAGAMFLLDVEFEPGDQPRTADVEHYPSAPGPPANLTSETVAEYTVTYEERRLYNDVLTAHSYELVGNESIVNICRTRSVTGAGGAFRVELLCAGGIDNRDEPDRQEMFEYSVTYRITGTTTEQVAIERFPYENRSTFDDRPATSRTESLRVFYHFADR